MTSETNNLKYEITEKSCPYVCGDTIGTVYRIRALKDFGYIHAGDFGGWIEKEANLSQMGESWICANSVVLGDARVQDNAILKEHCIAAGNALIKGNAELDNGSTVVDNAVVAGDTRLLACAVSGSAFIEGDIGLRFDIAVGENARITLDMPWEGPYSIDGPAYIGGDALIRSYYDWAFIGPIHSLNDSKICICRDSVKGIAISDGSSSYGLDEFCICDPNVPDANISEHTRRNLTEIASWMLG